MTHDIKIGEFDIKQNVEKKEIMLNDPDFAMALVLQELADAIKRLGDRLK